uniref:GAG-pre-integrase domain-containing protein n=1 Tax=Cannabis sativa TaxID=3483 RepID=A0A803Q788_CANSA
MDLDSSYSFHMTPNKDLFTSYEENTVGAVLLGNNNVCKILRIGTVDMKMHDGVTQIVQNVRYVPDLERNLLLIGMFCNHGYTVRIDNNTLNISKGSLVVVRGRLKNGMYYMIVTVVIGTTSLAINNAEYGSMNLWHLRLGHVSERVLSELDRKGLFQGGLNGKINFNLELSNEEMTMKKEVKIDALETSSSMDQIEVDSTSSKPTDFDEASTEDRTTDNSQASIKNYQLARDRERRATKASDKYGYAEFIAYVLVVVEDIDSVKPSNYIEAIIGKDSAAWLEGNYLKKVLDKLGMKDAKPITTPLALHFKLSHNQSLKIDVERKLMENIPYANGVGSLMYAIVCTRPDMTHRMSVVTRFISDPSEEH